MKQVGDIYGNHLASVRKQEAMIGADMQSNLVDELEVGEVVLMQISVREIDECDLT